MNAKQRAALAAILDYMDGDGAEETNWQESAQTTRASHGYDSNARIEYDPTLEPRHVYHHIVELRSMLVDLIAEAQDS